MATALAPSICLVNGCDVLSDMPYKRCVAVPLSQMISWVMESMEKSKYWQDLMLVARVFTWNRLALIERIYFEEKIIYKSSYIFPVIWILLQGKAIQFVYFDHFLQRVITFWNFLFLFSCIAIPFGKDYSKRK